MHLRVCENYLALTEDAIMQYASTNKEGWLTPASAPDQWFHKATARVGHEPIWAEVWPACAHNSWVTYPIEGRSLRGLARRPSVAHAAGWTFT
jgi:hypothetical protein